MPAANVRGANLVYEVLGNRGPWVVLSGGGRSDLTSAKPLARLVADAGYRVLIHDRRNCGASEVVIEGDSEQEVWADDLYELLRQLNALPVYAGGCSSGCRLALLLTIRHPGSTAGLLLWRPSGGPYAADSLAKSNHDEYIEAARRGGMAAVCDTPFFAERIAANPANLTRLMTMDPGHFVDVMIRWRAYFSDSADLPMVGTTEAALRSITVPTCIIAGQDNVHPRPVSKKLHEYVRGSELHELISEEELARQGMPNGTGNVIMPEDPNDLAAIFLPFLARVSATTSAAKVPA